MAIKRIERRSSISSSSSRSRSNTRGSVKNKNKSKRLKRETRSRTHSCIGIGTLIYLEPAQFLPATCRYRGNVISIGHDSIRRMKRTLLIRNTYYYFFLNKQQRTTVRIFLLMEIGDGVLRRLNAFIKSFIGAKGER